MCKRRRYKTRDNNRLRGVSTLKRSGPRWRLSVSGEPLPVPRRKEDLPQVATDPDHGLWQFFYADKKLVPTPAESALHGRAWTVEELRRKSWEDLHKLFWVCHKEVNRIQTALHALDKFELGYGEAEMNEREEHVSLVVSRECS